MQSLRDTKESCMPIATGVQWGCSWDSILDIDAMHKSSLQCIWQDDKALHIVCPNDYKDRLRFIYGIWRKKNLCT